MRHPGPYNPSIPVGADGLYGLYGFCVFGVLMVYVFVHDGRYMWWFRMNFMDYTDYMSMSSCAVWVMWWWGQTDFTDYTDSDVQVYGCLYIWMLALRIIRILRILRISGLDI